MNGLYRFLVHRAKTALRAMADRLAADSALARAWPPLDAPSLLKPTANGLRVSGCPGGSGGAWPVASWTTCHASRFVSRGRFLAMAPIVACLPEHVRMGEIETRPLPNGEKPCTLAFLTMLPTDVKARFAELQAEYWHYVVVKPASVESAASQFVSGLLGLLRPSMAKAELHSDTKEQVA